MGSEMCIRDRINTASGIGHDISAVLDGDETNPFILNDFYETELDDFTRGVVNFKFRDLEPGLHTLTFKGWDVYNNSSTQEIQFLVTEESGFALNNVLNYPNPFVSYTEFWFEHSGSINDFLEVQIQVFTCLLYTSPSPRDLSTSRMPSSA